MRQNVGLRTNEAIIAEYAVTQYELIDSGRRISAEPDAV